jgi:hypothetical protein
MEDISPIEELERLIDEMSETIANFSIRGAGVSGNIHDSYTVNAPPVAEAGPSNG